MKKGNYLHRGLHGGIHCGIKGLLYLPATLLMTLVTTASLVSCEDIFNSIFDTGAPGTLTASDGKYADRIEVSWSAPSLSSGNWEGKSVTGYLVEWTGPDAPTSGTANIPADQTHFTIVVDPVHRAKEYVVEVTSVIDGSWEGSSSDTGFALETYDLIWEDGGSNYSFPGSDRWYITMLQKGFRYDFAFLSGETGWIEFYDYGTLDVVHGTGLTGVSGEVASPSWICDEDGAGHKFYVRVVPLTPDATFRASFGF
jgi:hypothetical protein